VSLARIDPIDDGNSIPSTPARWIDAPRQPWQVAYLASDGSWDGYRLASSMWLRSHPRRCSRISVAGRRLGAARDIAEDLHVSTSQFTVGCSWCPVNSPTSKASYSIGGEPGADPEHWRRTAEKRTGTWWEAWADWVLERSGDERPAPDGTGNAEHPPLEAAPGSYVLDRTPPRP
jgi:hypothetical protein